MINFSLGLLAGVIATATAWFAYTIYDVNVVTIAIVSFVCLTVCLGGTYLVERFRR